MGKPPKEYNEYVKRSRWALNGSFEHFQDINS